MCINHKEGLLPPYNFAGLLLNLYRLQLDRYKSCRLHNLTSNTFQTLVGYLLDYYQSACSWQLLVSHFYGRKAVFMYEHCLFCLWHALVEQNAFASTKTRLTIDNPTLKSIGLLHNVLGEVGRSNNAFS